MSTVADSEIAIESWHFSVFVVVIISGVLLQEEINWGQNICSFLFFSRKHAQNLYFVRHPCTEFSREKKKKKELSRETNKQKF